MNTHVKITDSAATDLSRRSFLVGSAATGLVLGYAAVPGIDQALAAPSDFRTQRLVLDRVPTASSR